MLDRYLEIKKMIDALEAEKKEIEQELLMEIWDEPVEKDWFKVSKVKRRSVKVKSDVETSRVQYKFPMCVKVEIDVKALEKEPEAFDLLEVSESEYLKVTRPKNGSN